MDDYIFEKSVKSCESVEEKTHYLEIFCYDDPGLNTIEEGLLPVDKFEDFLQRKGDFVAKDVTLRPVSGLRLIVQQDAKHPETFSPRVISLQRDAYVSMVKRFHLPLRCIESSSTLGPFFWSAKDFHNECHLLQIIYRKADLKGWEVFLSHVGETGMTSGFCKGTISSGITECLKDLKACVVEAYHPMVLPVLIFSHDLNKKSDIKHREARDWLRKIEDAVRIHTDTSTDSDLDSMNVGLVECHAQVIYKPPIVYLQIIEAFNEALVHSEFVRRAGFSTSKTRHEKQHKIHSSILARLEFFKRKLLGTENYARTTLQRLEIQRGVLNGLIAQRESLTTQRENRLSFEMAKDQRRIALASKQDSSSMKTISILGIVFLPGTFLASILSTTFFDFYGAPTLAASVSPRFWLFWAVDIPMTMTILGIWLLLERRRGMSYRKEAEDIGENVDEFVNIPGRSGRPKAFLAWEEAGTQSP